jgi:hypothetical protein
MNICFLSGRFPFNTGSYFSIILDPSHHGLARPQVADGGDGLQICRVAANTVNNSRGKLTRGGHLAWGLGEGLTNHHKTNLLQNVTEGIGMHVAQDRDQLQALLSTIMKL